MPWIDPETLRKVSATQRRYRDHLARAQAEQRLDALETALDRERERRGMAPVTNDDGTIIRWVHTRQQPQKGRR